MADIKLFLLCVILITIGTVMSYSLSTYPTILYHYGALHFFIREFATAVIGILLMWVLSHINMDKSFLKIGSFIFITSFICLIIFNFLPNSWAPAIGGAKRWLKVSFLPIAIAPTEFFKIGFVFFLTWSFTRKFKNKRTIIEEIIAFMPYLLFFAVILILVAWLQNDFGQTFLLGLIMVGLLAFCRVNAKLPLIISLASFATVILLILSSSHRIKRVQFWWSMNQDFILRLLPKSFSDSLRIENLPEPYQVQKAINALHNGGLLGQGIGKGTVKLGFLSDVHTDMVLAGITEETGLIGLSICTVLFFFVIYRILKIGVRLEEKSHSLFCIGSAMLIGFSFLMNALGITGLIPLKGIAVPFLSYGGSSLIANCILIGIILSLSKKVKNLG